MAGAQADMRRCSVAVKFQLSEEHPLSVFMKMVLEMIFEMILERRNVAGTEAVEAKKKSQRRRSRLVEGGEERWL